MAFNYGGYPTWNPGYNTAQQYATQMAVQAPQSAPNAGQGLSPTSRPVSNREEAMGIPADFSGSLMVFPDVTHNRVYIKHWNFQTGAADFLEFSPVVPEAKKAEPKYATIDDLNALREELMESRKAGKNNDE